MYFIVGKTINQSRQVVSYLITNGEGIREVTLQQVYVEYQNGNLPYLKGINSNTGEVDFKNIDNSLIPTFYNGRGISNSVSVLKILEENNKQIGVRILVASGKIMNVSLSDTIKLVNTKKIQLFNAKIVNNKVVMKIVIDKQITVSKKVSTKNIVRIISPEVENAVVKGFNIRLNGKDSYVSCEDLCKLNARDDIEIEGDCFKKLFIIQKGSYNDKIQYIRRKDVTFRRNGDSTTANNILDKLDEDVLRNSKYCIVPYGASCVYHGDWGITLDGWPPEHTFIKDFIKKVNEVSNIDTVIVPKTYVGDLFYFFPKKINFTNRIMFYTLDFDYLSIADDIYERLYDNEQALYCINSVEAWYGDCGSTQFTSKYERSGPFEVFELHDYKGKSKSYSVYWDVDRINISAFKNSNIETLYLYRDDVVFLVPGTTIDEVYAEGSFSELSCKSLQSIIIRGKPSDETQYIVRLMNSGKTKIKYAYDYDEDPYRSAPMLPKTYYGDIE